MQSLMLFRKANLFSISLVVFLAFILSGCGGGGGTSATTYSISGTLSGAVLQGVAINLTGAATASTTTDSSGNYSFSGLADGNYTVTPSLTGYTFNPTNIPITLSGANSTTNNFVSSVVPTYIISGTVSGAVVQGVAINLSGPATSSITTDSGGNYSFSGIADGNYTLTPSLAGYAFNPVNSLVTVNGADSAANNFVSTVAPVTYSISGTVSGDVVQGVAIDLSGAATATTTTDSGGNYIFSGLSDGSYTITPSLSGYSFNPASNPITVSGVNSTANDFVASAVITTYIYYSSTSSIPQIATLDANGTLSMDGLQLTGFSFGASATDASGTLTSWAAPWNNINQPKVQAMLFCGTNNKLAYVLLLSNTDDPNRTTSTVPNLLSAIESAPQYTGMGVYTDCSGTFTSSWNNNLPLTNYYLWPDVITTYSYATVANMLNNAAIFYETGVPSNQDNYLAITRMGNSPFEVWQ
jgi:Carboxypeptidase regulatory-like domain